MTDPNRQKDVNKVGRNRIQAIRAYKLHVDGMTVRQIAALIEKTEQRVSSLIKIGERFSDNGTG